MADLNRWLGEYGDNILYIYGGDDTWSSTSVMLSGKTNAVKMVLSGGSHSTRISNLTPKQKELVYRTLEKWLEMKIIR